MSWNLGYPEIKDVSVSVAKELLEGNIATPQSIKDYVVAGLDGLVAKFGDDVRVTVTGHGHLCDVTNKDSYEVTSASVDVRRA